MTYREKENKKKLFSQLTIKPRKANLKCYTCKKENLDKVFQLMESVEDFNGYVFRTYCKHCFIRELGLDPRVTN